jgi:peptidyl-prolyl cis-trans isomerase D
MSIIQRIRDRAAWVILIAIAIALIGFLVQDAFVGKGGGGLFGGNATDIGSVNGKKLEAAQFDAMVAQIKNQYRQYNIPLDDATARDRAWDGFVAEATLEDEFKKLGITVTPKELDDMLYVHPTDDIKNAQPYKNPQTGQFDPNLLRQQLAEVKKSKNKEQIDQVNLYLANLMNSRTQQKFASLLSNTTYYPKWFLEKQNSDNSSMASVSYVNVPYSSISDSTLKVSDDDVQAYINKHKEEFTQEESRSVAYVAFDASPSADDTAALVSQLQTLKAEFSGLAESDVAAFVTRNASQAPFYDAFVPKSTIQVPNKDSIFSLPKGGVFGPYQDAGSFVLAKKIDEKVMPDSVRARHILIATGDPRTGQQILEDSVAKKRIDSVRIAIEGGSRFDSLAAKLSDDRGNEQQPGSAQKGGDLGYFAANAMVKEFNDFVVNGKKGERKVVKTDFGYHYIEITDQKNFGPAYKIAYVTKAINSSQATEDKASGLANQFASESRNAKAFDETARKRNYNKLLAGNITPLATNVPAIGESRQLVKWVYGADLGDVSEVFNVGSRYVVVLVTEINKKGTMSAARARPLVEGILKNEKKAEQIKKKIGTPTSLEDVAAKNQAQVLKADSVRFESPFLAGQEGKVGGYVFNAAAKGKISAPIAGNSGVYVLRTENVFALPSSGLSIEQQRQALTQQNQQGRRGDPLTQAANALKKSAKIKDNRNTFF